MPTYSYACTECGHRFDQQQAFTDDALTECPSCAGRLRKVYSAVGVVFKGSGFYRTDSRASASDGAKGSGGSESGGGEKAIKGGGSDAGAASSGSSESSKSSGSSGSSTGATGGAGSSGSSSSGGASTGSKVPSPA